MPDLRLGFTSKKPVDGKLTPYNNNPIEKEESLQFAKTHFQ